MGRGCKGKGLNAWVAGRGVQARPLTTWHRLPVEGELLARQAEKDGRSEAQERQERVPNDDKLNEEDRNAAHHAASFT